MAQNMKVNLYGHECPTLPLNSCAVRHEAACTAQRSWCTIQSNNTKVVLRVKGDADIELGDAVSNPWVLDALKLKHGTQVVLEPIDIFALVEPQSIVLEFMAYQSQKHWDEVAFSGHMVIPHTWTSSWPADTKVSLIEKHCQLALLCTAMCDGAAVAVQALDSLLVFRVRMRNNVQVQSEHGHAVQQGLFGNELCEYHITFPATADAPTAQADGILVPNAALSELCFVPAISTIKCICDATFSGTVPSHGLVKSMVVAAPLGGGKTHLLDTVASLCARALGSEDVHIVKMSCAELVKGNTASANELTAESSLHSNSSTSTADRIRSSLLSILRMLKCTSGAIERLIQSNNASLPKMLILLDDMDCVFSRYSSNKDENIPHVPDADAYKLLGYHLTIVLSELAAVDCTLPVVIVGATRKSSTQLLRAHTGCPEFEMCTELCSPTYSERVGMLTTQLARTACCLQPLRVDTNATTEPLHTEPTAVSTRKAWAERLAGLTAGYLPGDLHAVVHRMMLLHRGKLAALKHQKLESNQNASSDVSLSAGQDVIQWGCALDAVVAIVPRQLHGLSAQSGRQGSSTRLAWQDFAGYEELIVDLKRRLLPRTVTAPLPPSSTTAIQQTSSSGVPTLKASVLRGLVLYGPTGCGKTLLASIITSELKMNFVSVRSTDLLSKYFGETENTIRNLFSKARSAAPCVLFFDDFDSLAHKRSAGDGDGSTSNGLHGRILSTFLNELDGIMSTGGGSNGDGKGNSSGGATAGSASRGPESQILVIAACQDLSNLDEALIRPGRLQHHVFLHQPREQDIRAILHRYMGKLNCGTDLDTEPAVAVLSSAGASASEVECFVRSAFMHALREKIHSAEAPIASSIEAHTPQRGAILQKHVDLALQGLGLPSSNENQVSQEPAQLHTVTQPSSGPASAAFSWSGEFSAGIQ